MVGGWWRGEHHGFMARFVCSQHLALLDVLAVECSTQGVDATLLRSLESLKATLQLWRTKRAARMQAYEALMVRTRTRDHMDACRGGQAGL